jgi:hypothetical protein
MKKLVLIMLLCVVSLCSQAKESTDPKAKKEKKERTIDLWGHIQDSFTKVGVLGTKITLMRPDSTVIDTMTVDFFDGNTRKIDTYYKFTVAASPQKFIIKAEHPDYYPTYIDYNIKYVARNTYFDAPWHFMKKRPRRLELDDHQLKEAVVTATRIKMVYKGDTVIYNADAFNLSKGSMLDDLVKQMPGVELKDNGEIFMNGKKVDYLMLNGKQFFKGKNSIMLENMPYYIVKNVQFYNKTTDKSEYLGRDVETKDFVMDVKLKKEYSIGYIASAEVAGGTKDRYMGRLFGLRYSDNTRISFFGNMNNINEYQRPGRDGDWTPTNSPEGLIDFKRAGVDISIDDKDQRYANNLSATVGIHDVDYKGRSATETFLNTGNTFSRSDNSYNNHSFVVWGYNQFTLKKPFYMNVYTSGEYYKFDNYSQGRSATFNADPVAFGSTMQVLDSVFNTSLSPALSTIAINRQFSNSKGNGHEGSLNMSLKVTKKFKWGDEFDITINGDYLNSINTTFDLYQLNYLKNNSGTDFRNKYSTTPNTSYNYTAGAGYIIPQLNHWNYHIWANHTQRYYSNINSLYRLDRLSGWGNGSGHSPGDLPSTRDSLLMALDAVNTYSKDYLEQSENSAFRVFYEKSEKDKSTWFNLQGVIQYKDEKLKYQRNTLDTLMKQTNWIFIPEVTYSRRVNNFNREFRLNYDFQVGTPDMTKMVNIRDDTNPLAIWLGNPNLKNSMNQHFSGYFSDRNPKTQRFINLSMNLSVVSRQVANAFSYNAETGVYTYRPENVDGNWNMNVTTDYSRPIDKNKLWIWENHIGWNYNRSVDLTAVNGSTNSNLSKVNNNRTEESLKFKYQKGDLQLGMTSKVQWYCATSERENFQKINACDFNYGMTGVYKLFKKIDLASDIKMFSRRGYADASLNSDNLIWNASVGCAFVKGTLITRLEGFDILQQLTSVQYYVNGQGKTETWRNTIPSYLMLHLIYRLNSNPKNKSEVK